MTQKTNYQQAMQVSWLSIVVNVVLSAFKMIAGIVANSAAMVSDAVHSLSDVFSTVIVMIGIKMAAKKSDKEHPYGHERFECVAAIILAVLLCLTGIGIGYNGLSRILAGNYQSITIPGQLALIAAIISIVVKEGMFWYTRHIAKRINSGVLMADAWHHRSDALSSIGSFIGILGARLGYPVLDSVACLVICLFIVKAAVSIFRDAIKKMTDTACDDAQVERIREIVTAQNGVLRIDSLRTRLFGDKIYIDVEISADGDASLTESHAIAEAVHDEIESKIANVKHCMVHVNPYTEER